MLCAAAIPHIYDEDNVETEDLEPSGQLAGNRVSNNRDSMPNKVAGC